MHVVLLYTVEQYSITAAAVPEIMAYCMMSTRILLLIKLYEQ